MGARPSSFRKGGGFLDQVDGVITGYEFTDVFPGGDGDSKKKKKSDFHSLYVVLQVRVDGADEDVQTTLWAGDADQFEVSEDGHTLEPLEEGYQIGASTAWGKFITSVVVDAGFPEDELPEEEINYEVLIGRRFRFAQRLDADATKKFGKRKGKNGKEYDRRDLVATNYYPGETPVPAGKQSTKAPAGKAATTAAKPTKGKTVAEAEVSVEGLAIDTLLEILKEAKDHKIAKSKVSMAVLRKLVKHPQREDVRKVIFSDEFLGQADMGWSYDATDKNQTIKLDE